MNYFFVDYENVGSEGLKGIHTLDEQNTVFIFHSKNADKITFELHIQLNESKADIKYFYVDAEHKNALDFQLSSYLGYIIKSNETSTEELNYFIVSKDIGFTSLIPFWEKNNIKIETVAGVLKQKVPLSAKELEKEVTELTGDKDKAPSVTEIILKSRTKTEVNQSLCKLYQSTEAGKLYRAIKPLIANKQSS